MAATKMTKTAEATAEVSTAPKTTVKKFDKDDEILCRSITSGELLMVGKKTGNLYSWADYGYETEVVYEDLLYDVRGGKDSFSTNPRFIIMDDDFVEQNAKVLEPVYNSLYTTKDLRDIIDLPANQLKEVISGLPNGARESLKSIVSTMISNGSFDSVSKIKVLDEIFDTQMLAVLVDA